MNNGLHSLYDIAKHLNGYPFVVSHVTGVNYIIQGNKGMSILLADTETGQPIGWTQPGMYPNPIEKVWALVQDLREGPEVDLVAKDGWDTGKVTKRPRDGLLSDFEMGGKVTRLSTDTGDVMDAVGFITPEGGWTDGEVVADQNSVFELPGTQGAEIDRAAGSEEPDYEGGVL